MRMKNLSHRVLIPIGGLAAAATAVAVLSGCAPRSPSPASAVVGVPAYERRGDEIVIAGQMFHTGAPVVLWTDPGGYDAYRVEKRFGPLDKSAFGAGVAEGKPVGDPARYGTRFFRFAQKQPELPAGSPPMTEAQIAQFRGGGWDLPALQQRVDQFVLHYDVCGVSKQCFRILHDVRGLSVHFMLDIDGTIYQTLDLKERAFHATTSNDRSIGIEIANMGAYAKGEKDPLGQWYIEDISGKSPQVEIRIPEILGDGGVRTKNFVGKPDRPMMIRGVVQGRELRQYDLTPQQYDSLIKLTATLCTVFPNMPCDYPRDEKGQLITRKLDDTILNRYRGVLGHYHIQDNKTDPGPALQWDRVIDEARKLMHSPQRVPTR